MARDNNDFARQVYYANRARQNDLVGWYYWGKVLFGSGPVGLLILGATVALIFVGLSLSDVGKRAEPVAKLDEVSVRSYFATPLSDVTPVPSLTANPFAAEFPVAPRDQLWILTERAAVYEESLDVNSDFAWVHAGKPIHVTGVTKSGAFLRIVMHNGRTGYIRANAAEYKAEWLYAAK
jgi:hypothetical protein